MTFKGTTISSLDGVILSIGPIRPVKKIYRNYGTLPGSSVPLFEDTGNYDPFTIQVTVLISDLTKESSFNIAMDGTGKLILGGGTDYYKARVLSNEPVQEVNEKTFVRRVITFECEPFLFLAYGDTQTVLTKGGTVVNPGLESDPYFKITGSGTVVLTINGVATTMTVDQYVEIEFPFAWKGTANRGKYLDNWPKLAPGKNVISWTGTVTEVKMAGRWRTL